MGGSTQTRGWRCLSLLKTKIRLPSRGRWELSVTDGARKKLNTAPQNIHIYTFTYTAPIGRLTHELRTPASERTSLKEN